MDGKKCGCSWWTRKVRWARTAVGIIPCGKGKVIVSTLDIASQLKSAEVARKLLCNFVEYAGKH
jgi:hypothetical protein